MPMPQKIDHISVISSCHPAIFVSHCLTSKSARSAPPTFAVPHAAAFHIVSSSFISCTDERREWNPNLFRSVVGGSSKMVIKPLLASALFLSSKMLLQTNLNLNLKARRRRRQKK
jgi:hypothetical protein